VNPPQKVRILQRTAYDLFVLLRPAFDRSGPSGCTFGSPWCNGYHVGERCEGHEQARDVFEQAKLAVASTER
jgi:hypothetical protein